LLWCEAFRPTIGVLLNLGTNHLDRHHDRQHYMAAKARLFQQQTPHDHAVLNGRDAQVVSLSQSLRAQRVWFGANRTNPPALWLDPTTCRALSENAQAVLQVGRLLGVPDPLSYQVIRGFRGLPHRLEYVATIHGVSVVNDSKSTTPESLLYALNRCLGPVVVIMGGKDKNLDFGLLHTALQQERIRGVVLIGESRRRLRALINGSAITRDCETLEAAVQEAMRLTHPGDTVLFSPACASFDMFRNFEERGQIFKQLVHQLQNGQRAVKTCQV
jgi:UDP-N-acetylmuramoylalanine--D-glutamate ligase